MAASRPVPSPSNARQTEPPTKLRLSTPPEVLTAVPYLLGFPPERSLVVLCMHGKKLGLTLRADFDMHVRAPGHGDRAGSAPTALTPCCS